MARQEAKERTARREDRDGRRRSTRRRFPRGMQWLRHAHLLGAMPVFSGCSRAQLWRIARWGDLVEAQPGHTLVRQDRTDYTFFVILSGSARVTKDGEQVAMLHRGAHFGEVAIVGFRPQPATVTAAEPTLLFVIGRRQLLSLVARDRSIQHALFPEIEPGGYRAHARELHEQGRLEWERLRPDYVHEGTGGVPRRRMPGRRLSWNEAVELLSHQELRPPSASGLTDRARQAVATQSFLVPAAAVLATVLAVGAFTFHPPYAVVTPAGAVDVVEDITISGVPIDLPTGRYLLTSVNVQRPTLAGTLFAIVSGRRLVSTQRSGSEQNAAREAFLNSHRQAIGLAEDAVGVDPSGITIVIRDRGIGGSSAGLIYALAIVDMLHPDDLADGRIIAATGELRGDGSIVPVEFVDLKARAAFDAGAELFLVPLAQEDEGDQVAVRIEGIRDLADAVRILSGDG